MYIGGKYDLITLCFWPTPMAALTVQAAVDAHRATLKSQMSLIASSNAVAISHLLGS